MPVFKRYKMDETISTNSAISHFLPRKPMLKFGNMYWPLLKISIVGIFCDPHHKV